MTNYKINNKLDLEEFISCNLNNINDYINREQLQYEMPIYSSVDIRESKDKYAPIDNNIYPAGFNNLCKLDLETTNNKIKKIINTFDSNIKNIGIIPEAHTKNTFYLDHLAVLKKLIQDAGYNAYFISVDKNLFTDQDILNLVSHSGYDLEIHKAKVIDGIFYTISNEIKIDFILLNNDQSEPLPIDWKSIKTPIAPPFYMGWYQRKKNTHFECYNTVINKFCNEFSIDPNLMQANFSSVENIDFSKKDNLDHLAKEVDKFRELIGNDKKIFVKACKGTYGMGISVVSSGNEISEMNRKVRNKMDIGKNKIKFNSVLIQEGVETIIKYDNMPAEVTIYLINGESVGGFTRANSEKSTNANLNSKGMVFRKFCITELRQDQDHKRKETVYSTLARLSTLASGYEISLHA